LALINDVSTVSMVDWENKFVNGLDGQFVFEHVHVVMVTLWKHWNQFVVYGIYRQRKIPRSHTEHKPILDV